MNDPKSQSHYQVRFDWGVDGAARIAGDAHVLVWADALPLPKAFDPLRIEGPAVVSGTTGNATAVAQWILELQARRGDRSIVAVIAAGSPDAPFAVEDLLAAGAVIDALSTAGLDSTSPEAAAASAAYEGLRRAVVHLSAASVNGQLLPADVRAEALATNAQDAVHVLREWSSVEQR